MLFSLIRATNTGKLQFSCIDSWLISLVEAGDTDLLEIAIPKTDRMPSLSKITSRVGLTVWTDPVADLQSKILDAPLLGTNGAQSVILMEITFFRLLYIFVVYF